MMSIQSHYRSALNSIKQMSIQGTNETISGVWYFIVPDEERTKIQNQLKQHLEMK